MNASPRATVPTRALASLLRAGRAGRAVAPGLDRLRSTGLSFAVRQRRVTGGAAWERLAGRRSRTYRHIWEQAAAAVGARVVTLDDDFLLLCRGGVETLVRHHLVMLDHPSTTALALDKTVVHRLLRGAGVPVPEHIEVDRHDIAAAMTFVCAGQQTCVVKPARGTSGGEGVTCGVEGPDDLLRAWVAAARWDDRVLVERRTHGDEYRLLFLDGELLDVVRRRPPTVTGDGRSTVADLITRENRRRLDAGDLEVSRLVHVDLDCDLALRQTGLSPATIVPHGRDVAVKSAVSENAGVDNTTVRDVSPELVREAAAAARLVRLRLAGIDVVTPDHTRSLAEAGGVVLEVNATPGLHYHYQIADAERSRPVAVAVLECLLADVPRASG